MNQMLPENKNHISIAYLRLYSSYAANSRFNDNLLSNTIGDVRTSSYVFTTGTGT
jgi:hypothetical protein